jgi:tyrosyl-tRNA synthetase
MQRGKNSTNPRSRLFNMEVGNNYDWMCVFNYLDFLRDVGKHFPVNVMLTKDSVKSRMEAGLSYTEFSYMLLQAHDFVHLNQWHGCTLQIGGSDQWGNITAGIDLARRMRGIEVYGMTCPLLTKSDGTKMGKGSNGTGNGDLWLSAEMTQVTSLAQTASASSSLLVTIGAFWQRQPRGWT